MIGTPPGGGRRRTSSSSLCETPPPPNMWQVSPVSVSKHMPNNSPLRRSGRNYLFFILNMCSFKFVTFSGTSPPILSGPLAKLPILSSPNLSDNNNLGQSPVIPFGTRAVTLPEISEMGNIQSLFSENTREHPLTFLPPELPEETLLEVNKHVIDEGTFLKITFYFRKSTMRRWRKLILYWP